MEIVYYAKNHTTNAVSRLDRIAVSAILGKLGAAEYKSSVPSYLSSKIDCFGVSLQRTGHLQWKAISSTFKWACPEIHARKQSGLGGSAVNG